jgi:nicotinamide-nucleotide amidase
LATSGIAGPSGGTAAKPVGLVYLGLAGPQGGEFRELKLGGHLSRRLIRDRACSSALNLLRRRLLP